MFKLGISASSFRGEPSVVDIALTIASNTNNYNTDKTTTELLPSAFCSPCLF